MRFLPQINDHESKGVRFKRIVSVLMRGLTQVLLSRTHLVIRIARNADLAVCGSTVMG